MANVSVVYNNIKAKTLWAIPLEEKYTLLNNPIEMLDKVIHNTQIGRSLVFKCFIMAGWLKGRLFKISKDFSQIMLL